jgi:hypothetical protein
MGASNAGAGVAGELDSGDMADVVALVGAGVEDCAGSSARIGRIARQHEAVMSSVHRK